MKPSIDTKSILCGALLGAGMMFAIGASTSSTRTGSEYRLLQAHPAVNWETVMNSAAAEGWEFVGTITDPGMGTWTVARRPKR